MDIEQPDAHAALRGLIQQSRRSLSERLELSSQADPTATLAGIVVTDIGHVRADVAASMENVRHLPSKGFVVATTITSTVLIGAIVIFADKLRALIAG